jgi:hypothetical protein
MSETIITFQDALASALKQLDFAKVSLTSMKLRSEEMCALHDRKTCLEAEIEALQSYKNMLNEEITFLKQEKTALEEEGLEPALEEEGWKPEDTQPTIFEVLSQPEPFATETAGDVDSTHEAEKNEAQNLSKGTTESTHRLGKMAAQPEDGEEEQEGMYEENQPEDSLQQGPSITESKTASDEETEPSDKGPTEVTVETPGDTNDRMFQLTMMSDDAILALRGGDEKNDGEDDNQQDQNEGGSCVSPSGADGYENGITFENVSVVGRSDVACQRPSFIPPKSGAA